MADTSFDELKVIMDIQYAVREKTGKPTSNFHKLIVGLLNKYGITLRNKDGSDPKVTFSIPTSMANAFVVGLRYTKKDNSKTEDHFLFQKSQPIERCYGKKLEKLVPEYKGTHKLQR